VALAADLWQGPGDAMSAEIVQWALETLNAEGLVIYSLGRGSLQGFRSNSDTIVSTEMFTRIRATEYGFKRAGFPPPKHLVHSSRSEVYRADQAIHPGDHTDFRTLSHYAFGGPIVVEDIVSHMRRFPHHIHDLEGIGDAMPKHLSLKKRTARNRAVFVTADDEEQATLVQEVAAQIQAEAIRHTIKNPAPTHPTVIERKEQPMMTVEQIMAERGITRRQALKHAYAEEAARWGTGNIPQNQKAMALEALNALGKPVTTAELQAKMQESGFTIDAHSLTHVIWAIQKQGFIRFRDKKNSTHKDGSHLVAIRLLPAGVKQLQAYRSAGTTPKLDTPIREVAPARRDHPLGPQHPRYIADLQRRGAVVPAELVAQAIEDEEDSAQRWRESHPVKIDTSTLPDLVADRVPEQLKAESSPVTEVPRESIPQVSAKEAQVPASTDKEPETDTHTEYSVTKIAFQMGNFPLISALRDRKTKVEAAAELLMDAGQDELALTALSSVKYTPFEEEVLRLLKTLG
jgi:hypothetical protein